jgi:hypothetical protein
MNEDEAEKAEEKAYIDKSVLAKSLILGCLSRIWGVFLHFWEWIIKIPNGLLVIFTCMIALGTFGILVLVGAYFATGNVDFRIAELVAFAGIIAAIIGGLFYALRDKMDISHVDYICVKLAHLASMKMQDKYMAHATKDEYLLPSELFEDGFHVVEVVAEHWLWKVSLSRFKHQAVIEFGKVLKKERDLIDLGKVTLGELVNNNEPWANIREAAQKCLAALGFDLDAWEKEQLSK